MSLGWNTEAAILPKKSKPIHNVDSRTMLGLKAIVYEQEQRKSQQPSIAAAITAKRSGQSSMSSAGRRKDAIFSIDRPNRGVESRKAKEDPLKIAKSDKVVQLLSSFLSFSLFS